MKVRVERDVLADAVTWAARSLPNRPTIPVLSGLLLSVGESDSTLAISGFDLEASTEVDVEVAVSSPGQVLVSGRLLAEITRALPSHPVEITVDGPRATISCGSVLFTLPTMPVEDYPRLPSMPTTAGTLTGAAFATAVGQVAIAAGRDDTLPMLTGVRLEIDGERLTLAATDRYRLAVRELTWNPQGLPTSGGPIAVLVPARALAEAARSLAASPELEIALSASTAAGAGEGIIGFRGVSRRATTRLLDAQFPPYRTLLAGEWASTAEVGVAQLAEAVRRVALVAGRGTPVRLEFSEGSLALQAGGEDEGRAEEHLEVRYDGDPITTAFNPQFLLDGLGALEAPTARLQFSQPNKPVILRPAAVPAASPGAAAASADGGAEADRPAAADYTYLIMPVRLPG